MSPGTKNKRSKLFEVHDQDGLLGLYILILFPIRGPFKGIQGCNSPSWDDSLAQVPEAAPVQASQTGGGAAQGQGRPAKDSKELGRCFFLKFGTLFKNNWGIEGGSYFAAEPFFLRVHPKRVMI